MVWPSYEGPANVFHACLRSLHAPYKGALIGVFCVELRVFMEVGKWIWRLFFFRPVSLFSLLFVLSSDLCMPINVGEECLCKHSCFSVRFA